MDKHKDIAQNEFRDQPEQQFESDTEKLAHRHLSDPNHIISEDEIRAIRVGMAPPPDKPTEEALQNADKKIADHKADNEDDTTPGAQKATPWDVLGP